MLVFLHMTKNAPMCFRLFFAKKPGKLIDFGPFWAKYAQKQGFWPLTSAGVIN